MFGRWPDFSGIERIVDPISVGCYAFKSYLNGKYLRYQSDSGGIIKASGVDVVDPCGRFFVEPPVNKPTDDASVHIRCSYNNKYWVCRKVNDDDAEWCISADAHEPEEDVSKDGCTLFAVRHFPLLSDNAKAANSYAMMPSSTSLGVINFVITAGESHPLSGRLLLGKSDEPYADNANIFVGINLENHVVLPPRVCFRSDNGMYLCVPSFDKSDSYVQFKSINDNDYSSAMHTITTCDDGTIHIQSEAVMKYWRRGTVREEGWLHGRDGIWADDSDGSNRRDPDCLFQVLKHRDWIALKSLGNNRYCKRLTIDEDEGDIRIGGKPPLNILGAADEAITDEALLQLAGEPLQFRVVEVLEYHLADARVYDKKADELQVMPEGGGIPSDKVQMKFKLTRESTWTTTVTEKEAVRTVIKAKVPFMDSNGQLQLGKDDDIQTIIWGESISHKIVKWGDYIVSNPSLLRRTGYNVEGMSSRCAYEVPFSYSQTDTFADGKEYTLEYNDGLYRGVDEKIGNVNPLSYY